MSIENPTLAHFRQFIPNGFSSLFTKSPPLHLSRALYKSPLFMQNKPNFRKSQMNVSSILATDYKNFIPLTGQKNKPNSNPISSKTKMTANSCLTKDYENKRRRGLCKNKAKTNPISEMAKINTNLFVTKDYENKTAFRPQKNKPKTNPISNPVKIFLNRPEILNQIERITSQLAKLGAWVSIITMLILKESFMKRQYEYDGKAMPESSLFEKSSLRYQPKPAAHFNPDNIIITKGSFQTKQRRELVKEICGVYSQAAVIEKLDLPHNRIQLNSSDPLELHYAGKKTLVLGIHKSALRYSDEDRNTCPNYWHFSPYGFCPYDCQYCYLAGTPGVKYSPTVKIFLNLPEILNQIGRVASKLDKSTSFYLGKLQDPLALDLLTGYSKTIIPFFARQKYARLILLTKSVCVENLMHLGHKQHTILSWSLNPPEISSAFERNVPSPDERLTAMQKCADAGYPLRAVIMPIIPVEGWQKIYARFIENLLMLVPLERVTLGQICSYSAALKLTERELSRNNPISSHLERTKSNDARVRFPLKLRINIYRYLIDTIKKLKPQLPIGLCMEEHKTFKALNMESAIGDCNCVV